MSESSNASARLVSELANRRDKDAASKMEKASRGRGNADATETRMRSWRGEACRGSWLGYDRRSNHPPVLGADSLQPCPRSHYCSSTSWGTHSSNLLVTGNTSELIRRSESIRRRKRTLRQSLSGYHGGALRPRCTFRPAPAWRAAYRQVINASQHQKTETALP